MKQLKHEIDFKEIQNILCLKKSKKNHFYSTVTD